MTKYHSAGCSCHDCVVKPGLLDSPRIAELEQRLKAAEERIKDLIHDSSVDATVAREQSDSARRRIEGLQQAMTQLERDVAALQASSRRRATPAAKKRTRRPASAKRKSK